MRRNVNINGANADILNTDFFNKLELSVDVQNGKNVLVYSFEDLKRPVFVNSLDLTHLGTNLKIIHLNEFDEAVILVETDSKGIFDVPNSASRILLDVGYFMLTSKDKLVIEFDSNQTVTKSLFLILSASYSEKPHYYVHKFSAFSETKSFLKKDFDFLRYSGNLDGIFVNEMKASNVVDLSADKVLGFSTLFASSSLIPFDDFSFSGSDSGGIFYLTKKVLNKDCVRAQHYLLTNLRSDISYRLKNDSRVELYRTLEGNGVDLEQIQFLLDGYSNIIFSEKNKGYYDSYSLPSDSVVEVSNSDIS